MSDYTKKKQLLEDNEDMYISEYDKTLSYDALNRIVAAKKDFINAAKENDKVGMTKANDIANAVRAKYGNYTGGEDGSEFHPFYYTEDGFDEYESDYEDELDKLYSLIMDSDSEFSYDYEEDPAYQAYKNIYERQGSLAYDRALAENSLKTGGMENTNAQSAAMQAMNYYNAQLAAKIPELYRAAYERYYSDKQNDYKRLQDSYDIIKDRENRDYERYLDKIENDKNVRDFLYKQKSDIEDMNFKREEREAQELADINMQDTKHQNNMDELATKFENNKEMQNLNHNADLALQDAKHNNSMEQSQADLNAKLALETAGYLSDLNLQNDKQEFEAEQNGYDREQKTKQLMYEILKGAINDEKWRSEYNMDAYKSGFPYYQGIIGTGDILDYARMVFEDESLTMEDLYRILGI